MNMLIDSSVLIEFEKGTRTELLDQLLPSPHRLLINPIICSEYAYHLLGVLGGKSPLAIKEAKGIDQVLASHRTAAFLSAFEVAQIRAEACSSAISLMKKHQMLPNDALILACCLWESIPVLVSLDSDFVSACQAEGVLLVLADRNSNPFKLVLFPQSCVKKSSHSSLCSAFFPCPAQK